jgi:predicted nucleic acid-binding protein
MVVVDSSVWINYFRGVSNPHTLWLDSQSEHHRLGLTDLNLCEVLQGIQDKRQFLTARAELLEFEIFATGGMEFALKAAENFRRLRSKGLTIRNMAACWVATYCMKEGYALLHRDRDFDPFERELGLRVVKP